MEVAIELGKRIGAMILAACEKELYFYAFDSMAYPIQAKGSDLGPGSGLSRASTPAANPLAGLLWNTYAVRNNLSNKLSS
jgi:hypothetical protein